MQDLTNPLLYLPSCNPPQPDGLQLLALDLSHLLDMDTILEAVETYTMSHRNFPNLIFNKQLKTI